MAEPVNGLLRRQPVLNGLLGLGEPARMNPNLQAQGRNALASALRGTPSPFLDPEFYSRDLGPSAARYFSDPENALRALSVAPVPVLSDVAGLAADALMYKNKPESRNMLNFGLTGLGALPFVPNLAMATAWHGSPYKFDKFDAAHIGKGEGAQAYGHGVYFAESPKVAQEYKEKLSSTGGAKNLAAQYGGIDDGITEAIRRIEHYKQLIASGGGGDMRRANGMLTIAQKNLEDLSAMKAGLPENTGSLYKVDIPDEYIPRMLDWDKPLHQQSDAVQKALAAVGDTPSDIRKAIEMYQSRVNLPDARGEMAKQQIKRLQGQLSAAEAMTGDSLYRRLKDVYGDDGAAKVLREAGIPGIRYLDGGSRGTGQGTSNFVVFPGNEGAVKILERK